MSRCCFQLSGRAQPTARKIDNEFVQQQFGNQFTLLPEVAAVFGDLDGDGVEDVVIAARCKNPMLDQGEHNYTVIDPYYDFFGYGDPKVTTTFSEADPERRGSGGADHSWRGDGRLALGNSESEVRDCEFAVSDDLRQKNEAEKENDRSDLR